MPRIGAHMSVAGGLHLAFDRLRQAGGDALQIFSRNQRQWRSTPLAPEAVRMFRDAWEASGRIPVSVHDSYLTNLASPAPDMAERSVRFFAEELQRASLLSIPMLVAHPGSHMGAGSEAGIERFARHLDRALDLADLAQHCPVTVLLETTAGQGGSLGATFEELAAIMARSRRSERIGVCFDTCHAFAAGYDLRSPEAFAGTMERFDRTIGLDRLRLFHLNDSKRELGSRVDRHEHIGQGHLGLETFRLILNDPRLADVPMVIETPKGPKDDESAHDRRNIATLRSLASGD